MPTATPTLQPPDAALSTDARPKAAADVLISELAIPGRPEHVQAVRQFTALVLGVQSSEDDGIIGLLVSELVANSLLHSDSARPGGVVTILAAVTPGEVLIEVTDDGGTGAPALRGFGAGDTGEDAEHGRGLHLVEQLSSEWGHFRQGRRLTTWFALRTGTPFHSAPSNSVSPIKEGNPHA